MKFLRLFFIIFIYLSSTVKADLNKNLIEKLKKGEKITRYGWIPDPLDNYLID